MRLTIVGTGYVRLVTGAFLADTGSNVAGADGDAAKIEAMRVRVPLDRPTCRESRRWQ